MAGEEQSSGGTEERQFVQAPEAQPVPEAPAPTAEVRGPSLGERARHGIRANRWAGVVLIALGLALGGWWWAQQEALLVAPSRLGSGSTVTANPLERTSPAYEQAMEEGEEARRSEAVESGESFVEVMQSGQSLLEEQGAPPVLPEMQPPSTATADRADAPQEEEEDALVTREYPQPQPREPVVVRSEALAPAPAVAIDAMLEELIAAWSAAPQMTVIHYGQEAADEDSAAGQGDAGTLGTQGASAGAHPAVLVPAGRMVYAATKVGVDSELALPVLVEVLERPFVGALLRGEFQQVRDRMLVRFTRLSDERKGLDVAVNAYAVGLECECGAVDGEVDRHWFSRVILPAAFGFAQEYLAAAAQPQVTVSVDGQVVSQQYDSGGRERVARGLAGALGQTGDVVFESLPRKATVRLPRGTEFAVVFVDPVTVERG